MSGRKHRHMENIILRRYFNTERNLQEKQSVSVCDGYTELETIELGTHAIPKWIWKELNQAIRHLREGTLPIFIAHEKGTPYDDSIVMMRLSDYVQMRYPELSEFTQEHSSRVNERSTDTMTDVPERTSTALPLYGHVLCTCKDENGERTELTTFEQVNTHRRRGCYAR